MKRLKPGFSMFSIGSLYCVLLALGNLFIYEQQKIGLYNDFQAQQRIELNLLANLTREGLIAQNYALTERFFKHWGREYRKVVSLKLENTNGYSLISYVRAVPSQAEKMASTKRVAMYDDNYLIRLNTDTIELEHKLDELLLQLFLVSTGATMLLIVLLWFAFYKYAAQPLSEEIRLRKKIQNELDALKGNS